MREKCVGMIYDALAGDSTAGGFRCSRVSADVLVWCKIARLMQLVEIRILSERAVAIEGQVHKVLNYTTGNDYRASEEGVYQVYHT